MTERHSFAFRKFQLWADCEKHGWDRSRGEIADSIGIEVGSVSNTFSRAGWSGRSGDAEMRSRVSEGGIQKSNRTMGRKYDDNMLDVTELMRGTR